MESGKGDSANRRMPMFLMDLMGKETDRRDIFRRRCDAMKASARATASGPSFGGRPFHSIGKERASRRLNGRTQRPKVISLPS
jgi:hypothetical protein